MGKKQKNNKYFGWPAIIFIIIGFIIVVILGIWAFWSESPHADNTLRYSCQSQRIEYLSIPANWAIGLRPGEWFAFALLLCLSVFPMFTARLWGDKDDREKCDKEIDNFLPIKMLLKHPYIFNKKQGDLSGLLARDVGPLSFDVSTHQDRAQITEYRGLIHWHRDVIEKLLSLFLVITFTFFLAKGFGYLYDYITGAAWRFVYIPLDLSIAISLVGFALIIDGMVLVAAMTDAPGIRRTLDSLIVVLAGVVILFLEVRPGKESLVTFTLGNDPWLVIGLASVIALLFLVRWMIGHSTISELKGQYGQEKETKQRAKKSNKAK